MKNIKIKSTLLVLTICGTFLFSCTSKEKTETKSDEPVITEKQETPKSDTVRITLNADDKMKYDKSEIRVSEGQTVVLTLHHTGVMPVETMGHNFVLLTQGTKIPDFANEAIKAKDNHYIPTDGSQIIAHTEQIGGGGTTSITFKAPAKGEYDFLCTFPGHWATMKGKFIVE
ncbi:MAG: azurin [Bacteroidetes bacterium]|nr:azurin [Bacteroidota bacterium]MBP7399321.1 azurin [Chitinophagales bacterium]MBP9582936.1 azurin [Ignavibacterium sp.]MBK7109551.1 azurin [Bacteroidota bacterium]MBK8487713.1 azurin [Bacteroidota bacterium]